MKSKRRFLLIASAITVIIIGLILWHSFRHEQLYKVTLLPTLGLRRTIPEAINNNGQVVGAICSTVTNRSTLFVWDRENGIRDVGLTTYGWNDINNAGQIVGTTTDPNGSKQAFIWDPNDGIQLLGTLDGTESYARALNNKGQVVGYSGPDRDRTQAFIWDKTNGMRNITPDDWEFAMATAINDSGQIQGDILTGSNIHGPKWSSFYWNSTYSDETLTAIDISSQDNPLAGSGINNNGIVLAGTRRRRDGLNWACLWHKDAGLKYLFPCERFSDLVAFNDANQILCSDHSLNRLQRLTRKFFPHHGVHYLWDPKRGKVILNNQVPNKLGKLFRVEDINNSGCIVGVILLKDSGQFAGVLLEPIPERWDK